MVDEAKRKEILEKLKRGVVEFDEDLVREAAKEALEVGMDALDAIMNGLVAGMEEVGELFDKGEYFVPEVLMCADALYAGLEILRPHVKKEDIKVKGQVVIGVVEGDVHDIGKNLVKMMFEVAGFEVIDLGKDVPLEKFVEESLKSDADIVALSAMMTTTMLGIPKVIQMIREKNPKAKILVGGAPISKETAEKWGADGWAPDATNAVQEAINMIKGLKKEIMGEEKGEEKN
ncbi:Methionine synthase B12-binding module cap domain protein [Ferroglobus placidus DSM 10642]|uniref:Methionine synthase B12-binding module cap domain protein n=1 Tax=Ferroglobus placidus (strain DSM 10642 / AEDII12DO) TaxID=589924 RepID=D3RZH8_FERPA|nr:corrinoid protein [Ferroglobus placidus]ADC65891.1 Methionine synthase B12-binding module cap domain protein [Ferroglobus placidus DSM 10642]